MKQRFVSVPLKHLCAGPAAYGTNLPAESYIDADAGVRFLRTTDIGDDGVLRPGEDGVFVSESDGRDSILREGDVLFSRSGTIGRSFLYRAAVHGRCCHAGYLVRFRPSPRMDPRWLVYFSKSTLFADQVAADVVESTIANFNGQKFANLDVPTPPIRVQSATADFLDRKTSVVDELIRKKERLIELLEEKRQALVAQAVTKGLDTDAPMKDSGVEWIGNVPAHWAISRVKHVMRHIVDCPHSTPDYSSDGEFVALRTADVERGVLRLETARRVDEATFHERNARLVPRPGDIIYSREGERFGMAAPIPPSARVCLAQRVMLFRVSAKSDPDFIMWSLNAESTFQQARQDTVGATSPRINLPTICNAWIAVPPLAEQRLLATQVREGLRRIDAVVSSTVTSLDRLREYRQALITAAVTGQLETPTEAS